MKRLLATSWFLCLATGAVCLLIGGVIGFWVGTSNAGPLQANFSVAPIDANGCAVVNLSITHPSKNGRYVYGESIPPGIQCVVVNSDLGFPSLRSGQALTAKDIPGDTEPPSSSLSLITYPPSSNGKSYMMSLTSLPTLAKARYQGGGQTRLDFQSKTAAFQNTLPDVVLSEQQA